MAPTRPAKPRRSRAKPKPPPPGSNVNAEPSVIYAPILPPPRPGQGSSVSLGQDITQRQVAGSELPTQSDSDVTPDTQTHAPVQAQPKPKPKDITRPQPQIKSDFQDEKRILDRTGCRTVPGTSSTHDPLASTISAASSLLPMATRRTPQPKNQDHGQDLSADPEAPARNTRRQTRGVLAGITIPSSMKRAPQQPSALDSPISVPYADNVREMGVAQIKLTEMRMRKVGKDNATKAEQLGALVAELQVVMKRLGELKENHGLLDKDSRDRKSKADGVGGAKDEKSKNTKRSSGITGRGKNWRKGISNYKKGDVFRMSNLGATPDPSTAQATSSASKLETTSVKTEEGQKLEKLSEGDRNEIRELTEEYKRILAETGRLEEEIYSQTEAGDGLWSKRIVDGLQDD